MAQHGSTRRLSRMDILIVAAACLLLVLLVPVLFAKPREQASRILCGANLGQIGKTMLIYANDYESILPRAGGLYTAWGPVRDWQASDRYRAYGVNAISNEGGCATYSSCFYLLVKYYRAPPRLFICKGDVGTKEFKLSDVPAGTLAAGTGLSDLWDFGPTPDKATKGCSYAYQTPFCLYALTTARDSNSPVAADRNPWINSPSGVARPFPGTGSDRFSPDIAGYGGSSAQARNGNAITHQSDGQNVLFLDGRVTFETRPYCGVMSQGGVPRQPSPDNIYTITDMSSRGSPFGTAPLSFSLPLSLDDSVLLHDDATSNSGYPVKGPRTKSAGRDKRR